MSIITMPGLPDSWAIPGTAINIKYNSGQVSTSQQTRECLDIGFKLAAGTASANTVYEITDVAKAISLFGDGSELAIKAQTFLSVNQTTPLYQVAVAEPTGSKAANTVVLTGTTADVNGVLRVSIANTYVDVGISAGDTPTVIAAAAKAIINATSNLPVTADASTGTLTLTARHNGVTGNDLSYKAELLTPGTGITVTNTSTVLASGTGQVSYTTLLAALEGDKYYFICANDGYDAGDGTAAQALLTAIDLHALPQNGIVQQMFIGMRSSYASALYFALLLNDVRATLVLQADSDWQPSVLATKYMAIASLMFNSSKFNLDGFGASDATKALWNVSKPRVLTNKLSLSQLNTAIQNGITVITQDPASSTATMVLKAVTTKSKSNGLADSRCRDSHIVYVVDQFRDECDIQVRNLISGKMLVDDVGDNDTTIPPNCCQPREIKAVIQSLIDAYESRGWIQNAKASKAAILTERGSANRVNVKVGIYPVNTLDQVWIELNQLSNA